MMKRIIALLMILALLLGCAAAAETTEPEKPVYKIEEKKFPLYYDSTDIKSDHDFPLFFVDGADDLPFVDLSDWCEILINIFGDIPVYKGYKLTVTVNDTASEIVSIQRENGSMMTCNFADGEVVFTDYNAFRSDNSGLYLNSVSISNSNPDVVDVLGVTGRRERTGKSLILELKNKYGIPMIAQDGKYLMPLQTLSYLNLSGINYSGFFNKKELFFCGVDAVTNANKDMVMALFSNGFLSGDLWELAGLRTNNYADKVAYCIDMISLTNEEGKFFIESQKEKRKGSLAEMYYSAPKGKRSEALASYSYSELCMELDNEYGLQNAHNINGFAEFFRQTGLTDRLLDLDASVADAALGELTDFWFDDGHSGFLSNSYLTEYEGDTWNTGFSTTNSTDRNSAISLIRQKYKNVDEPYCEIGDTAIITLNEFTVHPQYTAYSDYYKFIEEDELANDTISQIIKAHQKIKRKNSPVKKVVLDLSFNGGGAANAAVFTVCWFLGNTQVSFTDPVTGAESTVSYRADVNLDHKYDNNDNLSGLELYCLISPESFSSGNLVPWAFKADGRVTLLGKTSGGGSCIVRRLTTAWGTCFQISGASRVSFVKNGAFYDVDRGVDPDCFIQDYNNFYDRKALVKIINGVQ